VIDDGSGSETRRPRPRGIVVPQSDATLDENPLLEGGHSPLPQPVASPCPAMRPISMWCSVPREFPRLRLDCPLDRKKRERKLVLAGPTR